MTGWRIGWMKAHPSLGRTFENLIQYSSSGVAQFLQRGAIAALDEGDAFLKEQIAQAQASRDLVCRKLQETGKVRFSVPPGAFYLFFSVDGMKDSTKAAFDIVDKALVGLAPGIAFGRAGEGHLRLCFHRRIDQVEEAVGRLAEWIRTV
jgi:aspartate/methionine/tyrosine aminotransferase